MSDERMTVQEWVRRQSPGAWAGNPGCFAEVVRFQLATERAQDDGCEGFTGDAHRRRTSEGWRREMEAWLVYRELARRRVIGRRDPYRKPLIPPVLSLPAACLILGFLSVVLVGLIGSVVIRRAF